MLTPPDRVADTEVSDAVRAHWLDGAVTAVHLPVGFGAHHWEVADATGHRLFVTLDGFGSRHSAESLEGAYAGAAALAMAGYSRSTLKKAALTTLAAASGRLR